MWSHQNKKIENQNANTIQKNTKPERNNKVLHESLSLSKWTADKLLSLSPSLSAPPPTSTHPTSERNGIEQSEEEIAILVHRLRHTLCASIADFLQNSDKQLFSCWLSCNTTRNMHSWLARNYYHKRPGTRLRILLPHRRVVQNA